MSSGFSFGGALTAAFGGNQPAQPAQSTQPVSGFSFGAKGTQPTASAPTFSFGLSAQPAAATTPAADPTNTTTGFGGFGAQPIKAPAFGMPSTPANALTAFGAASGPSASAAPAMSGTTGTMGTSGTSGTGGGFGGFGSLGGFGQNVNATAQNASKTAPATGLGGLGTSSGSTTSFGSFSGGFGQKDTNTTTQNTMKNETAAPAPTSAPTFGSAFGAAPAPTAAASGTVTSAAASSSSGFSFGKPTATTDTKKPDAGQSVADAIQPTTNARLVELEGKKVSAILEAMYNTLLKDLRAANGHASTLAADESNIEVLEEDMKLFSDKLAYVQQKQTAVKNSLERLYELQCSVLDIVKCMENYNQHNQHPLTHAINTVENSLVTLEQNIAASGFVNKDVLVIYQGLQKQMSIIAMLGASIR